MLAARGTAAGEGAAVLAASAAMGETVPPEHRDARARIDYQPLDRAAVHLVFDSGGGDRPLLMLLIYVRARIHQRTAAPRAKLATLGRGPGRGVAAC